MRGLTHRAIEVKNLKVQLLHTRYKSYEGAATQKHAPSMLRSHEDMCGK